mgnify:CR=1 FL=1|tara:strand:+ start:721 stop:900 length:180 start_codon:yes stop_codon:yes gene_type:complete
MDNLKRELSKIRRNYESKLIDIMFSLIDIEEELQNHSGVKRIEEMIKKIKEGIGKELSD